MRNLKVVPQLALRAGIWLLHLIRTVDTDSDKGAIRLYRGPTRLNRVDIRNSGDVTDSHHHNRATMCVSSQEGGQDGPRAPSGEAANVLFRKLAYSWNSWARHGIRPAKHLRSVPGSSTDQASHWIAS